MSDFSKKASPTLAEQMEALQKSLAEEERAHFLTRAALDTVTQDLEQREAGDETTAALVAAVTNWTNLEKKVGVHTSPLLRALAAWHAAHPSKEGS